MHSLIQTIYASSACPEFHEHAIPDLLRKIRPRNAKAHVTGMLLYVGTSFLQVLEGPAEPVDALFARIIFDSRHTQVTRLTREAISKRLFPDWTMDFATVHPIDVGQLIGRKDFGEQGSCIDLDAGSAKMLIAALRRPSWQPRRGTGPAADRVA
jgi:hypothetical protein